MQTWTVKSSQASTLYKGNKRILNIKEIVFREGHTDWLPETKRLVIKMYIQETLYRLSRLGLGKYILYIFLNTYSKYISYMHS